MTCKICGVATNSGYCVACAADKAFIDSNNDMAGKSWGGLNYKANRCIINHEYTVKHLQNMPSHLFFYGLKYLLMCKDISGETFNDYLVRTDRQNGDSVWERLAGYRGSRRQKIATRADRWNTNPLLPQYG